MLFEEGRHLRDVTRGMISFAKAPNSSKDKVGHAAKRARIAIGKASRKRILMMSFPILSLLAKVIISRRDSEGRPLKVFLDSNSWNISVLLLSYVDRIEALKVS